MELACIVRKDSDMSVEQLNQQGVYTEEFLFFFMGLRKCHCRHMVGRFRKKYPSDSPEKLAGRLVRAQAALSFTAGILGRLQSGMSSTGLLRLAGVAGRTVILSRMHVSLILKIALIFDRDIDDKERIPEIVAVIAATLPAVILTGSAGNETANITDYALSGTAGAAAAYLIGKSAILYYSKRDKDA